MALELNIHPVYVPNPGTTMVAAIMHKIIDDATVSVIGNITNVGAFNAFDARDITYDKPTVQYVENTEVAVGHVTGMSLGDILFDQLFSKNGICYYSRGASGNITKGMPAFHHYNLGPDLAIGSNVTMIDSKAALDGYNFPVVHGDLKGLTWALETELSCGENTPRNFPPFTIAAQDSAGSLSPIEVVYKGEAEVLVHVDSDIVANALYAIHHKDIGGKYYQLPVAWNGVNTGVTHLYTPWGLIKSVVTSSTTLVSAPLLSTDHSLAAQEYYVAQAFFWGEPCL